MLLVTGGAGFIGSNFIRFLFNKYGEDAQVVNLDTVRQIRTRRIRLRCSHRRLPLRRYILRVRSGTNKRVACANRRCKASANGERRRPTSVNHPAYTS